MCSLPENTVLRCFNVHGKIADAKIQECRWERQDWVLLEKCYDSIFEFLSTRSDSFSEDDVEVLLPDAQEWASLHRVSQVKVARYDKKDCRTQTFVVSSMATLRVRVESAFGVASDAYDLMHGAQYMDVSSEVPHMSTLILQLKKSRGKLLFRRGGMERKDEPPPRLMTLMEVKKRRREEYEEEEDSDEDYVPRRATAEQRDEEYVPRRTTAEQRSQRKINNLFDTCTVSPWIEASNQGIVFVGFSFAGMSVPEARTHMDDLFSVVALNKLDKKIKQEHPTTRRPRQR
jgi:hypothetical protein